jgi:hypothetical protein
VGELLRLWVDDKRPAPDGWLHVKTASDAIAVLSAREVHELALDHDLGHCEKCTGCKGYKSKCGCGCHWTGYSVALFMATTGRWPEKKPTCHSANPAGRANIEATVDRYFGKQLGSSPGEYRLTWRELEAAQRFTERHRARHRKQTQAAIGGRFSYSFTPTGLGIIAAIHCACRKKLTLTDFSDW